MTRILSVSGNMGAALPTPGSSLPLSRGSLTGFGSRPSRDQTMMTMARTIAYRSTCARRRVGCLLTDPHGRILAAGHNGSPMGHGHCIDSPCPGAQAPSGTALEACEAVHAEQNALLFCHDPMRIDTCYCTASPCSICVKLLMNTSCRRIVFEEEYPHPIAHDLWTGTGERKWVHFRG